MPLVSLPEIQWEHKTVLWEQSCLYYCDWKIPLCQGCNTCFWISIYLYDISGVLTWQCTCSFNLFNVCMYIYLFILIIYICVVFIQYDIDSMYISYTVTNNMYHTNLHQPNRRPRSTHLLIGHILQLMWFFGQFVRDDHEYWSSHQRKIWDHWKLYIYIHDGIWDSPDDNMFVVL